MILQCLIVEDDSVSRYALEHYCNQGAFTSLLTSCESAEAALPVLQEQPVDLLFLDVELPGQTGLELLQSLSNVPSVVFVSSEEKHAFEAFKRWGAIDYILKPVNYNAFAEATEKARNKFFPSEGTLPQQDFFVKSEGKLVRIVLNDILYIKNVGDYIILEMADGQKHISYATLKSVEKQLLRAATIFKKVHRSYIINTRKIDSIEQNMLRIHNQMIPIARSKKDSLMKGLNQLC